MGAYAGMSLISISMLLSHKDITKGLRQLQKWVLYSQGESNIPQDMNTPSSNWREQSSEETSSNPIKRKQELEILYVESSIEYIGFIVPPTVYFKQQLTVYGLL